MMTETERPTPALRQIAADDPVAVALISELDRHLAYHFHRHHMHGLHAGEALDPRLQFYVMEIGSEAVACGALRHLQPEVAEIKRMFVRAAHRRHGYGRQLLEHLEGAARAGGVRWLKLETAAALHPACTLYRTAGYHRIPAFGEYIGSPISVCMEKELSSLLPG